MNLNCLNFFKNDEIKKLDEADANNKLSICITRFLKVLILNFRKDDLRFFLHNLNDLKVSVYKYKRVRSDSVGCYYGYLNKIECNIDYFDDTIFHEFLHVASNHIDKNLGVVNTGFSRTYLKKFKSIGNGLNEGYTELLAKRYFNVENGYYVFEVFIAKKIEKIIGKEKMQSLYMNADLNGLISCLLIYDDKDIILDILNNIDSVSESINVINIYPKIIFDINIKIKYICEKLLEWNVKKIKNEYESNLINLEEFELRISKIIFSSGNTININNFKCRYLDKETIFIVVETVLKNIKFEIKK